ncbi:hypothetical protein EIP91_004744 [Steccherinum ochraceum]|uniref:Uncharacterized protein n=1 Tax=Steccherinum ochraceum TaxID=92696 RepID=A0A4R0RNK6_9APHY|nr:hypothetical protein EIP91_004744 [Steccherinum ochraceum]
MHFTTMLAVFVAFAFTAAFAAPLVDRNVQRRTMHARGHDLSSLTARDLIQILNARDMEWNGLKKRLVTGGRAPLPGVQQVTQSGPTLAPMDKPDGPPLAQGQKLTTLEPDGEVHKQSYAQPLGDILKLHQDPGSKQL